MTVVSPHSVGRTETRRSIGRPFDHDLDAAVLGQAPLGDVQFGHDLDARGERRCNEFGGLITSCSRPSMR